ncbi:unnamed protein product [Ambrosiozyma monospora]|uniref:Unnamed protein product n=1 Tax=Ambrosiozyma monospora TaxID=43982 RepID=A0ACB5UBV4_AMBMO|nr:unnamed protein product [Ambrosiozyma monospora]
MPYFGTYTNDTEDPELFATYMPKLDAYRAKLTAGILDEYKLPESLIPKGYGYDVTDIPEKILTSKEITITNSKAVEIVDQIATGNWTSVEVFKAFAKRATAAHQLVNCALELFIEEGLKRATELDEFYQKTGKVVGPLHGLPITLKEQMNYAGHITHAGYVGLIDNITKENALHTDILYEAGAIFYIRTTQCQSMMQICSVQVKLQFVL